MPSLAVDHIGDQSSVRFDSYEAGSFARRIGILSTRICLHSPASCLPFPSRRGWRVSAGSQSRVDKMVVRKGGNRTPGQEYEAGNANTFVMKACKDASYFVVGM